MASKKDSMVIVVHEWNKLDLRKPEANQKINVLIDLLEANNAGQVSVNQRMIAGDTLRMSISTSNRAQVVANIEQIENVELVDEPVNVPDTTKLRELTNEEIEAELAKHRAQLAAITTVAKQKGIKVDKSAKSPLEQLDMQVDKLGYAIGTRRHAENRVETSELALARVLNDMKWESPRSATEVAKMLVDGYRRAHDHHSFPSPLLSGKGKLAGDADVLREVMKLMEEHGDAHDDRIKDLLEGAELGNEPR